MESKSLNLQPTILSFFLLAGFCSLLQRAVILSAAFLMLGALFLRVFRYREEGRR